MHPKIRKYTKHQPSRLVEYADNAYTMVTQSKQYLSSIFTRDLIVFRLCFKTVDTVLVFNLV